MAESEVKEKISVIDFIDQAGQLIAQSDEIKTITIVGEKTKFVVEKVDKKD